MAMLAKENAPADDFSDLRQRLDFLGLTHLEGPIAQGILEYLTEANPAPARQLEPLTQSEAALFDEMGIEHAPDTVPLTPMVRMAMDRATLLADSHSTEDLARMLGLNPSRLRQRIAEGSLLALRASGGRGWRIPAFQFESGEELPGLAGVLRTLRKGVNPVVVWRFLTTPQVDLVDPDGTPQTPLDWMRAGADPGAVRALARDL